MNKAEELKQLVSDIFDNFDSLTRQQVYDKFQLYADKQKQESYMAGYDKGFKYADEQSREAYVQGASDEANEKYDCTDPDKTFDEWKSKEEKK